MTAPGNSAVLLTLLALFAASCGYAAGRLHQRYQTERDREEAYRDGYDTATRSVFSLAARVIAPRRAVRASAPVRGAGPVIPTQASPVSAEDSGFPVVPAAGSALSPAPSSPPSLSAPPSLSSPSLPSPPSLLSLPSLPSPRGPSPTSGRGPSLGFPVPPPAPSRTVPEPAAVGGVTYQPFPDPRHVDGSGPRLGGPDPADAAAAYVDPAVVSADAVTPPAVTPQAVPLAAPTSPTQTPGAFDPGRGAGLLFRRSEAGIASSPAVSPAPLSDPVLGPTDRANRETPPVVPTSGPAATATGATTDTAPTGTAVTGSGGTGTTPTGTGTTPTGTGTTPTGTGGTGTTPTGTGGTGTAATTAGTAATADTAGTAATNSNIAATSPPGLAAAGTAATAATAATGATSAGAPIAGADAVSPPEPRGRHTVPDELVQAATYRLPPDRIARAKVPRSSPPGHLPEDPTTRLPKPRES